MPRAGVPFVAAYLNASSTGVSAMWLMKLLIVLTPTSPMIPGRTEALRRGRCCYREFPSVEVRSRGVRPAPRRREPKSPA